jgi:Ca2+-binding EF-hand superfamily protein
MSDEQIERMVTDKMREQWSTMKKAFSELSKERLGYISMKELQSQISNWGIEIEGD